MRRDGQHVTDGPGVRFLLQRGPALGAGVRWWTMKRAAQGQRTVAGSQQLGQQAGVSGSRGSRRSSVAAQLGIGGGARGAAREE
jgi:hypothetical protein